MRASGVVGDGNGGSPASRPPARCTVNARPRTQSSSVRGPWPGRTLSHGSRGPADPTRIVVDSELRTTIRCRDLEGLSENTFPLPVAVPLDGGNYRRVLGRFRTAVGTPAAPGAGDPFRTPVRRLDAYRNVGWKCGASARRAGTRGRSGFALGPRPAIGREGFCAFWWRRVRGLAGAFFAAGLVDELSLVSGADVVGGRWLAGWLAARAYPGPRASSRYGGGRWGRIATGCSPGGSVEGMRDQREVAAC